MGTGAAGAGERAACWSPSQAGRRMPVECSRSARLPGPDGGRLLDLDLSQRGQRPSQQGCKCGRSDACPWPIPRTAPHTHMHARRRTRCYTSWRHAGPGACTAPLCEKGKKKSGRK
ncbi:hypothetical protein BS78_02G162100 [Paspalum vaginatum]|nr:hypothetical protein BS78_02G162100 [Paspalum vaginatum]